MEMGAESQCCHHNTHQSVLLSTDRQSLSTAHKYSPELDRLQNPFYYDVNKVLFEAHMYKLQRTQEL